MLPYPSLLLFRYPMAQKNPKRDRKTIIKVAVTSAPFICARGVEDKDKSLVGQQKDKFLMADSYALNNPLVQSCQINWSCSRSFSCLA